VTDNRMPSDAAAHDADRPTPGPLRVVYDHRIFATQAYGGISRYFSDLIPRVAATPGVEACVFMGLHINRYGLDRDRARFAKFWGLRRPAIPKTHAAAVAASDWLFARVVPRWRPRVYHATHYSRLAPRRLGPGVARVVTVHDFIVERFYNEPGVIRETIRGVDGLICVSEHTRRDLIEVLGQPAAKVRVVHHGNSLSGVTPGARPGGVDGPYLLFVGARHAYKNFGVLLRAYAASPRLRADCRVVCFGGGPLSGEEQSLAASLGVGHRVHVVPPGTDQALAGAYAHAAALVYPSTYEGFGLPLLEAMSQGCPVVASRATCLPEVGGDAALYFDPADPDDLRGQIESVVYDDALAADLRRRGRARDAQFSWERCARETVDFYRTLT
jgi:glycosyltransferase involved in cell wall biosynthesis